MKRTILLAALLLGACTKTPQGNPDIKVEGAWARETVAGQTGTAAYMTIANGGKGEDRLLSVSAEPPVTAMVHQTSNEGGVSRMRPLEDGLPVPAGQAGAQTRGPWFVNNNTQYDLNKKSHIAGSVSWTPKMTVQIVNGQRIITTNDLPTHLTGVFPVSRTDPARVYDANPNTITARIVRFHQGESGVSSGSGSGSVADMATPPSGRHGAL